MIDAHSSFSMFLNRKIEKIFKQTHCLMILSYLFNLVPFASLFPMYSLNYKIKESNRMYFPLSLLLFLSPSSPSFPFPLSLSFLLPLFPLSPSAPSLPYYYSAPFPLFSPSLSSPFSTFEWFPLPSWQSYRKLPSLSLIHSTSIPFLFLLHSFSSCTLIGMPM